MYFKTLNNRNLFSKTNILSVNCDLFSVRNILLSNQNFGQNYYQILGIERKSDKKAIRLAYLKLCKQFHPDLNHLSTDPKLQELNKTRIQNINIAYNCLIKDHERHAYDQTLSQQNIVNDFKNSYNYGHNYDRNNDLNYDRNYGRNYGHNYGPNSQSDDDFSRYYDDIKRRQFEQLFWYRRRGNGSRDRYYGIRNVKRVPNSQIVLFCLLTIFFGSALHSIAYNYTLNTLKHTNNDRKDNGLQYQQILSDSNDMTEYIRLFKELEKKSPPNETTPSNETKP